ncbi:hypothetical protein DRQ18_00295 [bacterium]|nr:MAG: hypothetical protein DRQ18_00295 [bacterium]
MVMVFLLLSAGEVNQDVPLWKKLSYSIGYSGGLCWRGKDLMPYCPYMFCWEWPFYYLHSIELSAIYPFGNGEGIEVGVGYGWAYWKEGGLRTDIWDYSDDLDIHLRWAIDNFKAFSLYLSFINFKNGVDIGIEIIWSKAKGKERYYENWDLKESLITYRKGLGGGARISFQKALIFENVHLIPYIQARFAMSREIDSSSPWKEIWKDRLELFFTGVYVGIKIKLGV